MTEVTQDWATQGIRDLTGLSPKACDFQGQELKLGDRVLVALSKGVLAEGAVVGIGLPGFPKAVTVGSLRDKSRYLSVDADGVIKTQ
jgi:hypothetical protein